MGEQGPRPARAQASAAGPALSTQIAGWRVLEGVMKAGQGWEVGWANQGRHDS